MKPEQETQIVDQFVEYLRERCWDEIGELVQHYPSEQSSLHIDMRDLFAFSPALHDDLLAQPTTMLGCAEEAIKRLDNPGGVKLDDVQARPTDLNEAHIYGVADLREEHAGQYIGIEGHVSRVTACNPRITEAAFECERCGTTTRLPQPTGEFTEPHECQGCERQGPFRLNIESSEFVDQRKIQLKQPPEESASGDTDTITIHMEGDVADPPNENLASRVGEEVTVYGIVEMDQQTSGRSKTPIFDQFIAARDYDFERETDDVDIDTHREEFEAAANGPNPYSDFFESMAPDIYPYGRWPLAIRLGAAWLMGGVRVSPDDGSTYRGDIHMAVIGPPGVGKSKFSQNLAELSPGCEHRSATGLSSEVGLTAAAVQDDFADGDGWVLKPGILPRAKDHAILDEADKTSAELSRMNDALEGEQMAPIDKGGINAKLKTRVGLLCMANPNGGRWSEYEDDGVKDQVDIDDSLWSRFDGIVLLEDQPDEQQDGELAEHVLENYDANFARDVHDTEEDTGRDAPVSWDAMRAWVAYAREHVEPRLTAEAMNQLQEYYVEIRSDEAFAENSHPTARKLEAGIRFASAFAKIRLSEHVNSRDVEMAITLSKELLGQSLHDGELDADVFTEAQERHSQGSRIDTLYDTIARIEGDEPALVESVIEAVDIDSRTAEKEIEKLKQQGEVYEPESGKLRTT